MPRPFLVLMGVLLAVTAFAQYQQQVLYPNQSGQILLNSLGNDYKPDTVLGYGPARDTMFALIDAQNDSLSCVYTDFTIRLDANIDPTQDAFSKNINTEHTWPQSNGAANGFARSDMHHLYPTRVDVNADRGSFPFADIDDNTTQRWYYLDQTQSNVPNLNIDFYSEQQGTSFEPREDHKGNVARSMFYFYTIYRAEADAAAPTYFAQQRETLCAWHYADPVDETEWNRTQGIAKYQDDKANPFVLDCTLPARTYCSDINLECTITSTKEPGVLSEQTAIQVQPNPFTQKVYFRYRLTEPATVLLRIFNANGQLLDILDVGEQLAGEQLIDWLPSTDLVQGAYFYQISFTNQKGEFFLKSGMMIKSE